MVLANAIAALWLSNVPAVPDVDAVGEKSAVLVPESGILRVQDCLTSGDDIVHGPLWAVTDERMLKLDHKITDLENQVGAQDNEINALRASNTQLVGWQVKPILYAFGVGVGVGAVVAGFFLLTR